jgi:Uri superfamily endonuclease
VAQLRIQLPQQRLDAFRRYAARRHTCVARLVKTHVDYLLDSGEPANVDLTDESMSNQMAALIQHGGAFDWLAEEPDLYSASDGEPC